MPGRVPEAGACQLAVFYLFHFDILATGPEPRKLDLLEKPADRRTSRFGSSHNRSWVWQIGHPMGSTVSTWTYFSTLRDKKRIGSAACGLCQLAMDAIKQDCSTCRVSNDGACARHRL